MLQTGSNNPFTIIDSSMEQTDKILSIETVNSTTCISDLTPACTNGVHNSLYGLQGGIPTERYHTTALINAGLVAATTPSNTNPFVTQSVVNTLIGNASDMYLTIINPVFDGLLSGGNIALSNIQYILFNGDTDMNWRIGYDMGAFSLTNVATPLTIVTGTGSTDGFAIGGTEGSSFFEIKGSTGNAYFLQGLSVNNSPVNPTDVTRMTDFNNGLSVNSTNFIGLGGQLIEGVNIDQNGNQFELSDDLYSSTYLWMGPDPSNPGIEIGIGSGSSASFMEFYTTGLGLYFEYGGGGSQVILLSSEGGILVQDAINNIGVLYASDYSSNWSSDTPLVIPNIGYLYDNFISIGGSDQTITQVPNFQNGLVSSSGGYTTSVDPTEFQALYSGNGFYSRLTWDGLEFYNSSNSALFSIDAYNGIFSGSLVMRFMSEINVLDPVNGADPVTLDYANANYALSSGTYVTSFNTRTGAITLLASDVTTVLNGTTLTGPIYLAGDATTALEPASFGQLLNYVNGLNWKHSVTVSTTGTRPAYTTSSDFLTLTASSNGAFPTIDGISLSSGVDTILVKNESGSLRTNNGAYELTQQGSISTPWILTRTIDSNTSLELSGATYLVREGSTQQGQVYLVNSNPVTLGTTQITLALSAGPNTYLSDGITITQSGNVFSLNTSYTDGRYLQLTGGTVTGNIGINGGTLSSNYSGLIGTLSGSRLVSGGGNYIELSSGGSYNSITLNTNNLVNITNPTTTIQFSGNTITNTGNSATVLWSNQGYITGTTISTLYVPYTGATSNVNLGIYSLTSGAITSTGQSSFTGSGGEPAVTITSAGGSNPEALIVNGTSTFNSTTEINAGLSANTIVNNGTGGNGYYSGIAQSPAPATPVSGTEVLYVNSSSQWTFLGHNGFAASLTKSLLTASQVYSFPNSTGTFVDGGVINWPGTIYSTPTTATVTSGGVLTFAPALATQTANTFLAGPSSGSAATPAFRAIVANDIPTLLNTVNIGGTPSGLSYTNSLYIQRSTTAAGIVGIQNTNASGYSDIHFYDNNENLQLSLGTNNSGVSNPFYNFINSNSGNIISFKFSTNGTPIGTISTTASGTSVTGTGTSFTSTFFVGQSITANGETHVISAIPSDLSMTTTAWTNTNTNINYSFSSTTPLSLYANGTTYVNGRLGLLTGSPTHTITHGSTSTGTAVYNTSDQVTNYERIVQQYQSNIYTIGSYAGGTGTVRSIQFGAALGVGTTLGTSARIFTINQGSSGNIGFFDFFSPSTSSTSHVSFESTLSSSSVTQHLLSIQPTASNTLAGGYIGLYMPVFESSFTGTVANFIDVGLTTAANGGGTYTSKWKVDHSGNSAQSGYLAINQPPTAVSCSTSGTANFNEIQQGSAFKMVVVTLSAALGTASYTYATAFTNTPVILTTSGLSASLVTTNGTSSITITGATSTGTLILMGN